MVFPVICNVLKNKSVRLFLPAKEKFAASNGIQLNPWQSAFQDNALPNELPKHHNRFQGGNGAMGTIFFTKCVVLISVPMNYNPSICQVEVARYGEFDFGAGLSKKEGFSSRKHSDRAQVHLFVVSMYQNQLCWTISVEHRSAQKLHSAAITLLQIHVMEYMDTLNYSA